MGRFKSFNQHVSVICDQVFNAETSLEDAETSVSETAEFMLGSVCFRHTQVHAICRLLNAEEEVVTGPHRFPSCVVSTDLEFVWETAFHMPDVNSTAEVVMNRLSRDVETEKASLDALIPWQ